MTTVTVLSGPERRRRWAASEKARIVAESLAPGATVAAVARRHDVHPNLLHWWRRQAQKAAATARIGDAGAFVPVRIAAGGDRLPAKIGGGPGSTAIEVQLMNGVVLHVPEGAAVERAAQLAAVLSGLAR